MHDLRGSIQTHLICGKFQMKLRLLNEQSATFLSNFCLGPLLPPIENLLSIFGRQTILGQPYGLLCDFVSGLGKFIIFLQTKKCFLRNLHWHKLPTYLPTITTTTTSNSPSTTMFYTQEDENPITIWKSSQKHFVDILCVCHCTCFTERLFCVQKQ